MYLKVKLIFYKYNKQSGFTQCIVLEQGKCFVRKRKLGVVSEVVRFELFVPLIVESTNFLCNALCKRIEL